MRKIHFIFSLVLVLCVVKSNLHAQNDWNLISSLPQNLVITSDEVSYKFENNVTGPHHVECLVKKSDNYCQSYETVFEWFDNTYSPSIREMFFIDSEIGFFSWGMEYLGVKKTIDGGDSFELVGFSPTYASRMCSFDGELLFHTDGWVYNTYKMSYFKINGNVVYSTGRYIWGTKTMSPSENPVAELEFISNSIGFVTCIDSLGFAYILKTIDTGYNWIETAVVQNQRFSDIKFIVDSIGLVIGKEGMVLRTNDCGETWNEISLGTDMILTSLDMNENGFGVIVGYGGTVFLTNDYGETWEADDFFSSSINFRYAKVTQSNTLFVHTTEGDLYCNHHILNNTDVDRVPFEIYPNPAQDFINISLTENIIINQIEIYSLNGEKVLSSTFSKVDIQDLETGIYIVQVVSDRNSWLEKMIIM